MTFPSIRAVFALFQWPDAIVVRSSELRNVMFIFYPTASGFNGGPVTCSGCGGSWQPETDAPKHRERCISLLIERHPYAGSVRR